mmetsp:Transcript_20413/g.17749  ORF Transcript_20413/g.17749 Transcript_20413/m.17749 type:complete len:116 (+) Transcript_20413:2586-2933(+)
MGMQRQPQNKIELEKRKLLLEKRNDRDNRFNIKKIEILADSDSDQSPTGGKDEDFGRQEIVEEGEMDFDIHIEKTSRRLNPRYKGERRYSRISLGKELVMSKKAATCLRWGMNIE